MVLFNTPMKALMPKTSRPLHFLVIVMLNMLHENRQKNAEKTYGTHKNYILMSTELTVVLQSEEHNRLSYRTRVMKINA